MRASAIVALGSTGDPVALGTLTAALGSADDRHRAYAAWSLGRIGGREARRALEAGLAVEREATVREEIEAALEQEAGLPSRTVGG